MRPPQDAKDEIDPVPASTHPRSSQSVDWYHEGESRTVEVEGVRVTVRLIGRKGRRSRIAIVAPAGAAFREECSSRKANP
jgi:hypothetical protein